MAKISISMCRYSRRGQPKTRGVWNGMGARGSSTRPSGLAQTLDHVGMVFRPVPGHAPADIHIERGRRDCDGFLERSLRFLGLADLPEGCGEPAICQWIVGVRADASFATSTAVSYSPQK